MPDFEKFGKVYIQPVEQKPSYEEKEEDLKLPDEMKVSDGAIAKIQTDFKKVYATIDETFDYNYNMTMKNFAYAHQLFPLRKPSITAVYLKIAQKIHTSSYDPEQMLYGFDFLSKMRIDLPSEFQLIVDKFGQFDTNIGAVKYDNVREQLAQCFILAFGIPYS